MLHEALPLSMAGLAEAAEQFSLMIAWGGLLIAATSAFIAVARRSWIAVVISGLTVVTVTLLFVPW